MKYFLVVILSCLSLVHGYRSMVRSSVTSFSDVEPMATDPPSDLPPATKPKIITSESTPLDTPISNSEGSKKAFVVSKGASKFMATIRESPSEMYLCSATFIRKDALLTTARCLIGRDVEKLFVHSNSSNLETGGPGNLAIKNVYLHPNFDMSPVTMDFGLITLKKGDDSISPVYLPHKKIGRPGTIGITYTWRFTPDSDKFLIHERQSKIISNPTCFLIEQEIIPDDMACAEGLPFQEGHFDHGMPFIINRKGHNYLFGINYITGKQVIDTVDKIWKVDGIVPWIEETLTEDITKRKKTTTPKPVVVIHVDEDDEDDDDEEEGEEAEEEGDKKYIEQSPPQYQPPSLAVKNKKLRPNEWYGSQ